MFLSPFTAISRSRRRANTSRPRKNMRATLETEEKLKPGSPEFEKAMAAFRERMKKYRQERVYPTLPDWPVVCFYNMSKRRGEQRNWYSLPYEERRRSWRGHAHVGRAIRGQGEAAHHRLKRPRRCRMGRDAFRARHFSDQSDRLPDALRRSERGSTAISANFTSACNCPLDELFRRLQL